MPNEVRLLVHLRPAGGADRFRVRIAAALLAVILLVVLGITLFPSPVDRPFGDDLARLIQVLHSRGLPEYVGYAEIEFSANVVMFVPVGFALALLLSRRSWWLGALAGTAVSVVIEAAQWLVLPERTASLRDVLANGSGALIGAALATGVRLLGRYRDRLVIEDVRDGRRGLDPRPEGPGV